MNISTQILGHFKVEPEMVVLDGVCPFLALRGLIHKEKIKSTPIVRCLFAEESATRAMWIFCRNETAKIAKGKHGYSISEERIAALYSIGVSVEVYIDVQAMKYHTAAWVHDREAFTNAVKESKKRKRNKPEPEPEEILSL